jgi:hypothetical protein
MGRFRVRQTFVLGIAAILCFAVVQAVVAAPPSKAVVGVAYARGGSNSIDNNVYTTVVTMSVPAGKYQVTGTVTVSNQTGATIDMVACNAYGNANSLDFIVGSGDGSDLHNGVATTFPLIGVVSLPAAGSIRIECISTNTSPHNVGGKIVAVTVADIVP